MDQATKVRKYLKREQWKTLIKECQSEYSRLLYATCPNFESHHSGTQSRYSGNRKPLYFPLYCNYAPIGVNIDKRGHYYAPILRDYQTQKSEIQRTEHCFKLQCFQKHHVKDLLNLRIMNKPYTRDKKWH